MTIEMIRTTGAGRRGRRAALPAVGALLLLSLSSLVVGPTASVAAAGDPVLTDSALTRSGDGRFADLDVTVAKTKNLTNEAVRVSWQWHGSDPGSHATQSDTSWNYNYLSVFQCWGDGPDGPDRQQCQYGGQYSNLDAGTNQRLAPFNSDPDKSYALSRVVSPVDVFGKTIANSKDPLEYSSPDGTYPAVGATPGIVPMHASPTTSAPDGETKTDSDTAEFYDLYGTNEVPLARTNADGSGQVFIELQTVYESQFLGCGARLGTSNDATVRARDCWLVVVPRDEIDSDGEDVRTRVAGSDHALFSSPLSLSNWQHRITFPMQFEPVRVPCNLGGTERPLVGHESLSVAVSSWQGRLCAGGQGFFYASTSDDIARESAESPLPKYSIVTDPLPPDAVPPDDGALVYAPTAVSGVSVSFFIERAYANNVAPEIRQFNGTRVEEMRLTPRLVAKLLTQSYELSTVTIGGGPPHLIHATRSMLDDPDFQAVNKFTNADGTPDLSRDLSHLTNQRESFAKIFVTADNSDAVRLVWEWILADPDARAFLAGQPDPFGMTINPFFKGIQNYEDLQVPRADIPRLDGVCIDAAVGFGNGATRPVCPLDAAPYVASLDNGAALTARGQTLGSQSWVKDLTSGFIKPQKATPQLVGQRSLIALTDTPSAQRRGLVSASLLNAGGKFVVPTVDSMLAALGQAVDTPTPGVVRVPSDKVGGDGYPLTRVSYGVTNPALLDQAARNDYAAFATFAATDGQIPGTAPGQLPLGYAPLPQSLRAQALRAADTIRTATAPTPRRFTSPTVRPSTTRTASPSPTPTATTKSTVAPSSAPTKAPAGGVTSRTPPPTPAATPPVAAPSPVPATSAPPAQPIEVQRVSALTPAIPVSLLRWLVPALAGLGLSSALVSRFIVRRGGPGDS
jgi:hypothetical protein